MSWLGLLKRSALFYWRTHLAVMGAVIIGTAVLAGALFVGDSMQYTLESIVYERLGEVHSAMITGDRFFADSLGRRIEEWIDDSVAPVLQLAGFVVNDSGTRRVNDAAVFGVDERFFSLGSEAAEKFAQGLDAWDGQVILNSALAERLQVAAGDEVVVRVGSVGVGPAETPLTGSDTSSEGFRLRVRAIADASMFGRFGLQSSQQWPLNVFVPLSWLQERMETGGKANLLLTTASDTGDVRQAVDEVWQLEDVGLRIDSYPQDGFVQLASDNVFIDDAAEAAVDSISPAGTKVLTYFVNSIALGPQSTPYSMVTALDENAKLGDFAVSELGGDKILVTEWLAEDLGLRPGHIVELKYYLLGPQGKLIEGQRSFSVHGIVAVDAVKGGRELMPTFPGLADAENCRNWEAGIPIDLDRIREKDEQYWDKYRGTPKAFVSLQAGRKMWGNRFGSLTAVRYSTSNLNVHQLTKQLRDAMAAQSQGLVFRDFKQQGLKASREGTDFGQLFAGLSMFLIAAALILTGLLFVFGVQKRRDQMGLMLAVGIPAGRIKGFFLMEGLAIAVVGSGVGLVLGFAYTKGIIWALATVWRDAVHGAGLKFGYSGGSLAGAFVGGVVMGLVAIGWTLRKQLRQPARNLLDDSLGSQYFTNRTRRGSLAVIVAIVCFLIAAILMFAGLKDDRLMVGAYFGSGFLLLIGGLLVVRIVVSPVHRKADTSVRSVASLGWKNASRRPGRSTAVVSLLAVGVFLVISIGANRHGLPEDVHSGSSGTGGFGLIAESAVPITRDLNDPQEQKKLGFAEGQLQDVRFVPLRVREGEDASCFNLNRAQRPRLLGVQPQELSLRKAFSFSQTDETVTLQGWNVLNADLGEDVIPAVGDAPTVTWGLGKSIGDEIEYVDDTGRAFRVRLVGVIGNSIFQGNLIISEEAFLKRFPHEQGYNLFLVDVPAEQQQETLEVLTSRLSDYGLEAQSAGSKLASFSSVENTYLSVFQILGGLGMILGSIGLGVVVLRNVLDRRGELAMLWAIGYERVKLQRMILWEHVGLLAAGLCVGVASAVVAVVPAMLAPGAELPLASLTVTLAAIVGSGVLWIWLASSLALKGSLLEALRNE